MENVKLIPPSNELFDTFDKCKSLIQSKLDAKVTLIGSLAIPIKGKEEIDILVEVENVDESIKELVAAGFSKGPEYKGEHFLKYRGFDTLCEIHLTNNTEVVRRHYCLQQMFKALPSLTKDYEKLKESCDGLSEDVYKSKKSEFFSSLPKRVTISIYPPAEVVEKLKTIAKESGCQDLDMPTHLTLRESFYTFDVEGLSKSLAKIASTITKFPVSFESSDLFNQNYLVLKVAKSKELQNLHEQIMDVSQNYYIGAKPYPLKEELNEEQEELLMNYNSPYVMSYFTPHISLGKALRKSSIELNEFFEVKSFILVDKDKKSVIKEFIFGD